jgi:hypothetical protein
VHRPIIPQGREDGFAETEVGKELEKILSSDGFRGAEGLKRFLRYTVERTLHGEGGQLKEYRLGVEVFDRDSSFDPRLDPVVRMAARRLRSKLKDYYETEGIQDPIWIAAVATPQVKFMSFGINSARSFNLLPGLHQTDAQGGGNRLRNFIFDGKCVFAIAVVGL